MTKTITPLDVRERLGDLLNRVARNGDEYIIRRKGKPLAAMVPVRTLDHIRRSARAFLLADLRRPRPASLSQREADRLANEAKHESRRTGRTRR